MRCFECTRFFGHFCVKKYFAQISLTTLTGFLHYEVTLPMLLASLTATVMTKAPRNRFFCRFLDQFEKAKTKNTILTIVISTKLFLNYYKETGELTHLNDCCKKPTLKNLCCTKVMTWQSYLIR